ncbi:MAG: transcriptional regulator [Alphaproteobacteria bacterium]|nr:MAG: transcriptional regulator [Alphaproteobacteria bacterium]
MKIFTHSLPETGFIRLNTVLELIPIGKSSWWNGVRDGIYPQPVTIGQRVTAWRVEDIKELIQSLSNAE